MIMKDDVLLLVTGIFLAASAALFWRILGVYGFGIIMSVIVLTLIIDNARLRRQLREQNKLT
jgi:Flp pilus assembly protein TadB